MKGAKDRSLPDGFKYEPGLLSADAERALAERLAELPLKEFEFHGYIGKRRVVSFGWKYDFTGGGLRRAEEMPGFLQQVRRRAAQFAGMAADDLEQVIVTEYRPGAAIGWHRDKAVFGEVVGISLLSPCTFRFRRKTKTGWERASLVAEPRSAYRLQGPARSEWEHSIPAVEALRYSITFRTLRPR